MPPLTIYQHGPSPFVASNSFPPYYMDAHDAVSLLPCSSFAVPSNGLSFSCISLVRTLILSPGSRLDAIPSIRCLANYRGKYMCNQSDLYYSLASVDALSQFLALVSEDELRHQLAHTGPQARWVR